MLTAEEIKEIDHAIAHVPAKKAACIDALRIVQQHRRWISDETLKEVASYMEMTPEELDSVATFYNLIFRKPVGRNVILLCDSISCWVMGYERIYEHLQNTLGIKYGETSADGRFTLLPNPCLGTCDCAPALMINNDLHRNLRIEHIDELLKKYS